jgi:hypothetical protein
MHRARVRTVASATGGILLIGGMAAAPAIATTPTATPQAAPPPAPYTVVASGLNNPRHLSVGPHGVLYVAESGTGWTGPCMTSSEGGQVCYGPTGAITRITSHKGKWKQRRVVKGLPSLAPPADIPPTDGNPPVAKGGSATGPSGVVVTRHHRMVVSVGLGAPPSALHRGKATKSPTSTKPATLPKGFGTLLAGTVRAHHWNFLRTFSGPKSQRTWRVLADLARHEAKTNPVDTRDSNPASVVRDGSRFLVADAGGNTVLSVNRRGKVRTIASFPDTMVQAPGAPVGTMMPMQFVPTAIVRGPGHAYYVSQLTGFPFPQGGAAIWKVRPGHDPKVYASGLTNVTDLAFARDGSLYAVEISTAGLASGGAPLGALVHIPAGGGTAQTVVDNLFAPYGVALRGSNAYVTTGSILPGGGQVIQVPLH